MTTTSFSRGRVGSFVAVNAHTLNETELYDLVVDPNEQIDVSDQEFEVAERFQQELRARLDRIQETSSDTEVSALGTDAGVEERLRALG